MNRTTAERPPSTSMQQQATDTEAAGFTELGYVHLLELAKEKYQFCGYQETSGRPYVIWRHDIDYSPHRALALAKLEAGLGLRCIYHILLTSRYYNVFEHEVAGILRHIAALGHEIGLHFDMDAFGERDSVSENKVDRRLALEREVLEQLVGVSVLSMSYHNYTINSTRLHERETICGMLNASASSFTARFEYVSDSNGIWRCQRLADVLQGQAVPRLHVLTHPEWWTPEAMPPLARLRRAVEGRASANMRMYIHLLRRDGRLAAIGERLGFSADEIGSSAEPGPSV